MKLLLFSVYYFPYNGGRIEQKPAQFLGTIQASTLENANVFSSEIYGYDPAVLLLVPTHEDVWEQGKNMPH